MRKTFVKLDMPTRKYSKFLKVQEFLDTSGAYETINHDLFAAQSIHIETAFSKLFDYISSKNRKVQLVEIGTFKGGLTVIIDTFAKSRNLDYTFTTYDITDRLIEEKTFKIFEKASIKFLKEDPMVKDDLFDKDALSVFFCDGGNKSNEVNKMMSICKPGDIIMGHDYGYDSNSFQKKEWTAFELSFNQLKSAYDKNNLKFIFKEEMEEAVWFCAEKQK